MDLNESYWTDKYLKGETGWDIGYPSPAIVEYFKSIADKQVSILVPGGGNGHEVAALFALGFKNIYLLDLAKPPLENFLKEHPQFPKEQLIQANFFEFLGNFDFIVEQTFFCALNPPLRAQYVSKMHSLLKKEGKLVGLLFNVPFNKEYPPFGGDKREYSLLFKERFNLLRMEVCYNSIAPRAGSELFIEMSPLKV